MDKGYFESCVIEHHAVLTDAAMYISRFRDAVRFEGYCRECPNYAKLWSCPPFGFDIDAELSRFDKVYILGSKVSPAPDMRGMLESEEDTKRISYAIMVGLREELDRQLLLAEGVSPGSRACFAGPCLRCPEGKCVRIQGSACTSPDNVRPPLEALGFDVARTSSELLGIDMVWGSALELPEYFTFVSALMFPGEPPSGLFNRTGLPDPSFM